MHILFISERFPPEIGGVAASAGRIARALASLGHIVHVATLTRDEPAGTVARSTLAPGLELYRLGQSRNLDTSMQHALTVLEWLHAQHPFGLAWGHFVQNAGFLAAWVGRRLGFPVLLALRGNDFDRQVFPPGDLARLEWCLRRADHLVAVSQDLADKVHTLVERRPIVLPNAVDTELFHPGPRPDDLATSLALPEGEIVIGFSGELRVKKGIGFLLQALAEVRQRIPARLLVIGEVRGGDQGEYERLRVGLQLEDAITITGHLPEPVAVARHLPLCDVFVLPSIWEGMPNGLLEAMATALPVVASTAGGIPEIVIDGVNGLLVPRSHLHHLGRRILHCLDLSADERTLMTNAGRRTVLDRHSLPAERTALEAILAGVASSSS